MKKSIVTVLLALFAMTGWAQTKVNIHGVAAADAETIYFGNGLSINPPIDSTTVSNGKWSYSVEQPIGRTMLSIVADTKRIQSPQDLLKNMAAVMVDTTPTEVDLTTGTVKGSKASMAMNEAVRGLCASMMNNDKEEAFKVMHKAVMENLDSEIPVHFVPIIAEALSVGDLKSPVTRMSASSVQKETQQGVTTFNGMTDIYLFPAKAAITGNTETSESYIHLADFDAFNLVNNKFFSYILLLVAFNILLLNNFGLFK